MINVCPNIKSTNTNYSSTDNREIVDYGYLSSQQSVIPLENGTGIHCCIAYYGFRPLVYPEVNRRAGMTNSLAWLRMTYYPLHIQNTVYFKTRLV